MKKLAMVWLALLWAMLGGACTAPVNAEQSSAADQTEEAQDAVVVVPFSQSEFQFVTTVEEGTLGDPAGWQVARANLKFTHYVIPTGSTEWYCTLGVEMPIQTGEMGRFSQERAAKVSAEVANLANDRIDHRLPPGVFCHKFILEMDRTFKSEPYQKIGARVRV